MSPRYSRANLLTLLRQSQRLTPSRAFGVGVASMASRRTVIFTVPLLDYFCPISSQRSRCSQFHPLILVRVFEVQPAFVVEVRVLSPP